MNDLVIYLKDLLATVLPDWASSLIVSAVIIVLWIIIGRLLILLSKKAIFRVLKMKNQEQRAVTIAKLLSDIAKYVVWFIVGIIILSELNIDVTPFLASAGVIGLAVGFGAQEIVRDFMSGFFIIFEGSFNVGDIIEVDGFKGTVLELGLRTTSIQNWKGEIKVVNNGNIDSMINFSKADSIAIVDFGVSYDTDLQVLTGLMGPLTDELFKKYDVVKEVPQFLGVIELADSSINLRLIAKTETMQHFQVERDIRKDIVEYLNKHNIDIPFPHLVIINDKD